MSTSSCSLCNDIAGTALKNYSDPIPPATLQAVFHAPCDTCSQPRSTSPELCVFCNHLRLRHLSCCYGLPVLLRIFRAQLLFNRYDCALCRIVYEAALIQPDLLEGARSFELAFLRSAKAEEIHPQEDLPGKDRLLRDLRFQLIEVESEIGISIWDTESVPPEVANSVELAPLQPRIKDWSLIQAQLTCCISHHPVCATDPYGKLPNSFRVIDVLRRQIVPFPRGQRFVALSYVWGANPNPKFHIATRSSFSSITAVGGLTSSEMPQTIEDAIKVCEHLGEPYLWTDRLCIIQDDPADKAEQIHAMDAIYSAALFVVISLDGDHMDAGLAGVSRDRVKQSQEDIQGLRVSTVSRDYLSAYRNSLWYTRGWTYQEGILSRRKLYFDSSQIFFECDHSVWHEDQLAFGRNDFSKQSLDLNAEAGPEDGSSSGIVGINRSPMFTMGLYGGRNGRFGEYARHLEAYQKRVLTYQSDVYNAFYGVLQALYAGEEVMYGVPLCSFDNALVWRGNTFSSISENSIAPTWSWGSYLGQAVLSEGEFQGTLLSWKIVVTDSHSKSLTLKSIRPLDDPPSWVGKYKTNKAGASPRVALFLAWSEGLIERTPPKDVPSWEATSFEDLANLLDSRWNTYHAFWTEAFEDRGGPLDPSVDPGLKPGTLRGRAQVARFGLSTTEHSKSRMLAISNADGVTVGFLDGNDPRMMTEAHPRLEGDQGNPNHEFIALSISLHPNNKVVECKKPYRDAQRGIFEPGLMVAVLLIRRQGKYFCRVGSGRILLGDWVLSANPRFEDIFLM